MIYAQLMFFLDCPDIKLCVYAMRINDTAQYTALAIYYYRPSTDPFFLLSSMDVEFFFLSSRGGYRGGPRSTGFLILILWNVVIVVGGGK